VTRNALATLTGRTLVVCGVAGLVAAVVIGLMISTLVAQRSTNERVRHSEVVLRTALAAEKALIDVESGQRAFVIARRELFLESWRSGVRVAPLQMRRLRAMVADNAGQEARARAIQARLQRYLAGYSRPLVATARRDPARARAVVATAEGKRQVDALRERFGAFIGAERRLLTARTRRADDQAGRAIALAVAGLIALLLAVAAAAVAMSRYVTVPLQRLTGAVEQVAGGDLSVRVPRQGAAEVGRLSAAFDGMAVGLSETRAELRSRYDELERISGTNTALLDTVFTQAPIGLAVLDEQLRFVRINDTLAQIDGLPADDHLGLTVAELLPDLDAGVTRGLRSVLDSGRPVIDVEIAGETPAQPGEERFWRASYYPIRPFGRRPIGVGLIVVEITEERRLRAERERLQGLERLAARRTARLAALAAALTGAVSTRDVSQVMVDEGTEAAEGVAAMVMLVDEEAGPLELAALAGYDEADALQWREVARDAPLPLADAVRDETVLTFPDRAALLASYPQLADRLTSPEHRAWFVAPLRGQDRLWGAVLYAFADAVEGPQHPGFSLRAVVALGSQALDRAARYEREREIAHTLQQSLLPARLPDLPGLELSALYRAAGLGNEVGGDFYDVFVAGDGRVLITMGDVQGKGPAAAAVTALVRHSLRAEAMHDSDPTRLLEGLNRTLRREDSDRFCTVALAAVDRRPDGLRVTIACGGHPAPILTQPDTAARLSVCHGTLLGLLDEVEIDDDVVDLAPGDGLVLYTDGLLDARAPSTTLGPDDLAAALEPGPPLPADAVVRRLHAYALPEGAPGRDDIAIVCLRVPTTDQAEPVRPRGAATTGLPAPA
jgi:PAS domain S-box-containing protein